jgi:hypothetical protein
MRDESLGKTQRNYSEIFRAGLIGGIGWAIGVTLGFAIISAVAITLLDRTSVIPILGNWIAEIVENTQMHLNLRNPYYESSGNEFEFVPQ